MVKTGPPLIAPVQAFRLTLMLPSLPQGQLGAIESDGWLLRGSRSFLLASFSILLYDHLITFGDEVEFIWKKRKSPVSVLYLTNRYFAPPALAICTVAEFSEDWTINTCRPLSTFQVATIFSIIMIAEAMLVIRVYAVHQKRKIVLAVLITIWVAQLGSMSYILLNVIPLLPQNNFFQYGCDPEPGRETAYLTLMFTGPSLVFDGIAFLLLVVGLYHHVHGRPQFSIFKLVLRDSCLYWFVVCCVNFTWTVLSRVLPDTLKNILSFFSTIMTMVMMGRLTLNVRMLAPPLEGPSVFSTVDATDIMYGDSDGELPQDLVTPSAEGQEFRGIEVPRIGISG